MWPKGWLTPPCKGGAQRIKFEDGHVEYAPFPLTIEEDIDMAILTDAEQVKLQHFLRELEDVGSNVEFVRFIIPWYRTWKEKSPTNFVAIDEDIHITRAQ